MLKKLAILLVSLGPWMSGHAADRPNILFIAVDDLKPNIGAYGDTTALTPNMDRLAAGGTLFRNNHCQQAVCGPSRASLLTGTRPDSTQVWDLQTMIRDKTPDVITLPQHLRANGYATAGMGKIFDPRSVDAYNTQDAVSWSIPYEHPKGTAEVKGAYADPALAQKEAAARRAGTLAKGAAHKDAARELGLRPVVECLDLADDAYTDGAITKAAVSRLESFAKQKEEPFFLAVGFKKPHLPFVAPKKYWDLYERDKMPLAEFQERAAGSPPVAYHNFEEMRSYSGIPQEGPVGTDEQRELVQGYYACVSYIDAQIGVLLDTLKAQGLAENTIVVLWGDHGWHLGDHGLWCKHSNFEQATRAPLIIAAPGMKAGVTDSPTEFVDIYPTLCDLAGIEAPKALEGTSLTPILRDPTAKVKEFAVSQYPRGGKLNPIMGYSLRNERYRYTVWMSMNFQSGERSGTVVGTELYDYEKDPNETRNLVSDPAYAKTAATMQAQFEAGWPGRTP